MLSSLANVTDTPVILLELVFNSTFPARTKSCIITQNCVSIEVFKVLLFYLKLDTHQVVNGPRLLGTTARGARHTT